jgi:UDP-N-acetylglucosamine--N-acetylmuramyl-(pentapeptide) pyrophosphoryl-undecaprenol N-acetylglucosamine transferase
MSRYVILAAGGTGGHLFPAEALARELLRRGRPVALVTDRRGGNFPVSGVETFRIPAGQFGAGLRAKLRGVVNLARGFIAASRLLRRLKPGAVVGFGGYPSMPTMLAAQQLGMATVIHEQNAVLGRANAMLAPRVDRIATHFAAAEGLAERLQDKISPTGNPVRPAISALREQPYVAPATGGPLRILVIGGSQGARILSAVVPDALLSLSPELRARIELSQQARPEDLDAVTARYAEAGMKAEVKRFFDDMPQRLGGAHLVIGRAGGSTTAELTVAGRPAILVPYAAAIADEQTANARNLVATGAAWLLAERDFTAPALASLIERLADDPQLLADAAAAARAMGEPEAASKLADLVERVERERAA